MQLIEFAAAKPDYMLTDFQRDEIEVDFNKLSLEGLPSIDNAAASTREIRQHYFSWLSQRSDTINPQELKLIRNGYLFDSLSTAIPYLFKYKDERTIIRNGKIKPPNDFITWVNFCNYAVVSSTGNIKWEGVKSLVNAKLIENEASDVIYNPEPVMCPEGQTVKLEYLLLKKDDHFEFEPPTLFYFMAGLNYFLIENNEELIESLSTDHFLDKEILSKSTPALSFIAENILLRRPDQLKDYIISLAKKIGGEYGFAIATTIMEDLIEIYKPLLGNRLTLYSKTGELVFDVVPAIPLTETIAELKTQYYAFRYKNRPVTILPVVQALAFARQPNQSFSPYFEEIFETTGGGLALDSLFPKEIREPFEVIMRAAHERRKAEAATIAISADIFGYDKNLPELVTLMQVTWAAIIAIDDTIDFHEVRDGKKTIHIVEGRANAIEKAFLAMLRSVEEIVKNHSFDRELAAKFTQMIGDVYEGDLESSNLAWDTKSKKYNWNSFDLAHYEKELRRIAKIFSWFPGYAARVNHLEKAGEPFIQFMEDMGYLILYVNDIEDLVPKDGKHDGGNDVGAKISRIWWQIKNLHLTSDDPDYDNYRSEMNTVERGFNELAAKRRNGDPLDAHDKQVLDVMVAIGRKYLPKALAQEEVYIAHSFEEARKNLDKAFASLTKDDTITSLDSRNKDHFRFYHDYLNYLHLQIQYFYSIPAENIGRKIHYPNSAGILFANGESLEPYGEQYHNREEIN